MLGKFVPHRITPFRISATVPQTELFPVEQCWTWPLWQIRKGATAEKGPMENICSIIRENVICADNPSRNSP
jgi:hypothetical protein